MSNLSICDSLLFQVANCLSGRCTNVGMKCFFMDEYLTPLTNSWLVTVKLATSKSNEFALFTVKIQLLTT